MKILHEYSRYDNSSSLIVMSMGYFVLATMLSISLNSSLDISFYDGNEYIWRAR